MARSRRKAEEEAWKKDGIQQRLVSGGGGGYKERTTLPFERLQGGAE